MKYLLSAVLALFSCSCATVVRGTSDTARFESSPSSAAVTAESISKDKLGPFNCTTPCQLQLKRKRTWRVDFALEGYKPVSGKLKPVVTGGGVAAGAGNVIAGGIIGIGIDAGTGANLDLRPNPMIAELEPLDSPQMSRIPGAELITDEQGVNVGDEAGAPIADEDLEGDDSSGENSAAPIDTDQEEPVDVPLVQYPGLGEVDQDNANGGAKNVNLDTDDIERPAVEITGHSLEPSNPTEVRLYKPGERAPNDEVSDELNRLQLEKTKSVVNQIDNP